MTKNFLFLRINLSYVNVLSTLHGFGFIYSENIVQTEYFKSLKMCENILKIQNY